jgi:nicotinamide-nucleotide adenylyltransferase
VVGGALRALFYGRFQPFHLGHRMVVEWALARFDELLILVGMAEESHTPRNPFTARERVEMIRRALAELGADPSRVQVATMPSLPVGAASAHLVHSYTAGFDVVITNNRVIARAFADAGFRVVRPPLYQRDRLQGARIRELMARGDPSWRQLVPKPVADYIDSIRGAERVREVYGGAYG